VSLTSSETTSTTSESTATIRGEVANAGSAAQAVAATTATAVKIVMGRIVIAALDPGGVTFEAF
jgi:hypothetical protein